MQFTSLQWKSKKEEKDYFIDMLSKDYGHQIKMTEQCLIWKDPSSVNLETAKKAPTKPPKTQKSQDKTEIKNLKKKKLSKNKKRKRKH